MTASDTRVGGAGSGHEEGDGFSPGPGTAKEADVNLRAIRHELGITAELTELAKVRHWVRTVLRGLPANVVSTAVMVVDELTSNALRHGRAPYHVRLLTGAAKLRIEVDDGGGEPARRRTPSDQAAAGSCWWSAARRPGASCAGPAARRCGPSWPPTTPRAPTADPAPSAPTARDTGDRGRAAAPPAAVRDGVVLAPNEAARTPPGPGRTWTTGSPRSTACSP